ncbi:MAG: DUF2341 domain-containing protein [Patescibacteria group bacterium]
MIKKTITKIKKTLKVNKKRVLPFFLGALIILLPLVYLTIKNPKEAQAQWFNDGWAYRIKLPVTNNTTTESDVYISFTGADVLDTSATGRFQADCGDIRFTKRNGQLLPYYINSGCGTSSTDIDVYFEEFPSGTQDIYMYYGNPSVQNGFEASAFASSVDSIEIQRNTADVSASSETQTAPTNFTAFGSLTSAFVLNLNNRRQNAGSTTSATNERVNQLSGRIELTATDTITFSRSFGDNDDHRFSWESWEYTGSSGNSEFIVRSRNTVTLSAVESATATLDTTPTDINNVIPFITGIGCDLSGTASTCGTAVAWISGTNTLNVERGDGTAENVTVQVVSVEFTGSDWQVAHGDSGDVSADSGTITIVDNADGTTAGGGDISDWSTAVIFHQTKGDSNATNVAIADTSATYRPNANTNQVDWAFNTDHDSAGDNRHFVHVLKNPYMTVTRFTDTGALQGANNVDITSAGITDLSTTASEISCTSSGTGTAFGRGWKNGRITSTTNYEHWTHRSGNTIDCAIQIIDLSGIVGSAGLGSAASNFTMGTSGSEEKGSGPVGYWRFNEGADNTCPNNGKDACDSTSRKNDAAFGASTAAPTWQLQNACIFGKCLLFDGSDDVATVTNTNPIDFDIGLEGGFSVVAWVKASSDGENDVGQIFQKGTNTYLRIDSEGSDGLADLEFNLDLATTDANVNIANGITLNTWHHVTVTHDGTSTITVYIDGKNLGSNTGSGTMVSDANDLLIGGTTTANFHGFIDEFKIFNYERAANKVKTDAIRGASADGASAAFGNENKNFLNEGLVGYWDMDETTGGINDSSGGSNNLVNHGATSFVAGKFGNGGDFESGSSQFFTEGSTSTPAYVNSTQSDITASGNKNIPIPSGTSVGDRLIVNVSGNGDGLGSYLTLNSVPTGWTQIGSTQTYDGASYSVGQIVLTGIYDGTTPTMNVSIPNDPDANLIVGAYSNADKVDTYIQNIQTTASTVHTTTAITPNVGGGALLVAMWSGGANIITGTATDGSFTERHDYEYWGHNFLSTYYQSTAAAVQAQMTDDTGEETAYTVMSIYPAGTASSALSNSGSTTVSAWIKPESTTASTQYNIAGKWDSGNEGYLLAQYGDEIRMYIGSASNYVQTSATNLATGTWYHVVGSYDASTQTVEIYVDGAKQTSTVTGTIPSSLANTGGLFHIGAANSAGTADNFYDGVIDEVRVYSRSFSLGEVKDVYNWAPGPVAYWTLDENTGTTAYDQSGNDFKGNMPAALTAPSFRSYTEEVGSFNDFITINKPAGTVDDDIMIAIIYKENSGDLTVVPSGWTLLDRETPASDHDTHIYWKRASSEGASYTWEWVSSDWTLGVIISYSGAIMSGSPIDTYSANSSTTGTTITATSVTTTVDNTTVLAVATHWSATSGSWTGPSGYTARADINTIRPADKTQASAGATGDAVTTTSSGSESWTAHLIALKPPAAGAPAWVPGKFGSALKFDGSQDYIDVGTGPSQTNTVSFWVNPTTTTEYPIDLNGTAYVWFNAGTVTAQGFTSPTIYVNGIESSSIAANTWSHVAITTQTALNASDMDIGRIEGVGFHEGIIDDVRIYDYARTSGQIIEDMNGGHPLGGSPVGSQIHRWKFDEMQGDTAYDPIGNNNGNLRGACPGASTCPTWTSSGKINGALNFNPADDEDVVITTPSNIDTTGDSKGTITFWMQPDWNSSTTSTEYMILGSYDAVTTGDGLALFFCGPSTGCSTAGELVFYAADSAARQSNVYISNSNLSWAADDWVHVALVWDDTLTTDSMRIFINGVEPPHGANTPANLDLSALSIPSTMNIGNIFTGYTNSFDGSIDDFKVYNDTLTEDQIRIDMNANAAVNFSVGNNEEADIVDGTGNPPIGWWKLDENTGTTTVFDSSGNNNNGTMQDLNESDWFPGVYGSALYFDGINTAGNEDVVDIYSSNFASQFNTSAGTLSAWVKMKDAATWTDGNEYNAVTIRADSSNLVVIDKDNVSSLLRVSYEAGATAETVTYSTTTTDWIHLAITWDTTADEVRHYFNGVLQQTDTGLGTWVGALSSSNVVIGGNDTSGNEPWQGWIDDVKVYDYARTQAQIVYDYNRGEPAGWWKFDECQGTTVHDASGNGNDGTVTIGATGGNTSAGTCSSGTSTEAWNNGTTGKLNSSLDFDGTDDYVSIANGDTQFDHGTGDFSHMAWVKTTQDCTGNKIYVSQRQDTRPNIWIGCTQSGGIGVAAADTDSSSTGVSSFPGTIQINDGNWHHIALTKQGHSSATVKLYVDGILDATITPAFSGTFDFTENKFSIGRFELSPYYYADAQIDDVRVYRYALSPDQILKVMNEGSARFGPETGPP